MVAASRRAVAATTSSGAGNILVLGKVCADARMVAAGRGRFATHCYCGLQLGCGVHERWGCMALLF